MTTIVSDATTSSSSSSCSLQEKIRQKLSTIISEYDNDGEYTVEDIIRTIRDESTLRYETELVRNALINDPFEQFDKNEQKTDPIRVEVNKLAQLLNVIDCNRIVTIDGYCKIDSTIQILSPTINIHSKKRSLNNNTDQQKKNDSNSIIHLSFHYERNVKNNYSNINNNNPPLNKTTTMNEVVDEKTIPSVVDERNSRPSKGTKKMTGTSKSTNSGNSIKITDSTALNDDNTEQDNDNVDDNNNNNNLVTNDDENTKESTMPTYTVQYTIELSINYGPTERMLFVQVFTEDNVPSQKPAKNLLLRTEGDDDDDDNDWSDIDDHNDDTEEEGGAGGSIHENSPEEMKDDNGIVHRQATKRAKTEPIGTSNATTTCIMEDVVKDDNTGEQEEADDIDGNSDGFIAGIDPDVIDKFRTSCNLSSTALDDGNIIFLLMTFPFYEQEWDLVGYILESVFDKSSNDKNDSDDDDEEEAEEEEEDC